MPVADALRRELRGAAAAFAFLTVLPVGRLLPLQGADLAAAAPAFPVVGALIGAAVASLGAVLGNEVPANVAAAVVLAAGIVATGGLHLDGLADTADALGGKTAEHALAIMREPQVGSFGVTAVALVLIVETTALAELVAAQRIVGVAAAFAVSRGTAPLIAAVLPYARDGGGLAEAVRAGGPRRAILACLFACAVVAVGGWADLRWLLAYGLGCSALAIMLFRARFGGMTGDALGAAIVVTEAVCLVALAA